VEAKVEAVEAVKFLWKRKHFEERSWKRKRIGSILLFDEPETEAFFIKHGARMWKPMLEAEVVKRKHVEKRSWKRKQTRNRLTLYGAGSGSKYILVLPHPCFAERGARQHLDWSGTLRPWWECYMVDWSI